MSSYIEKIVLSIKKVILHKLFPICFLRSHWSQMEDFLNRIDRNVKKIKPFLYATKRRLDWCYLLFFEIDLNWSNIRNMWFFSQKVLFMFRTKRKMLSTLITFRNDTHIHIWWIQRFITKCRYWLNSFWNNCLSHVEHLHISSSYFINISSFCYFKCFLCKGYCFGIW